MNSETTSTGQGSTSVKKSKRPRKQVLVACNRCRRSKSRCDNVRPTCGLCQRANATCEYDTELPNESRNQAIRRQYSDLQALQQTMHDSLDWLRSQNPEDALSCLQQLKQAVDPMQKLCSIVATERAQRMPPGIAKRELLIASSPLIRDDLTSELTFQYPASFPWLPGGVSTLKQPQTQWMNTIDPSLSDVLQLESPALNRKIPLPIEKGDSGQHEWSIRFWTTVHISQELASNVLSSYLQVEHPVYGFFDANLFLHDLLAHRVQYCSPLLVNSVLFWACCTFGPIHPGASAFAEAFLEAAQRLLEVEQYNNTLLNVASLMILALSTICFGRDKLANQYMVTGIRMAEELSLLGERRRTAEKFGNLSSEALSMLEYVAWGAFNFSTVYLLHFHDVHSGTYTKCPPLLAKPGSKAPSPPKAPEAQISRRLSPYQGATFPFFCRFWCIAHEIASMLYSSPGPVHRHVPLAFAESKLQTLLEWAERLPPEAARSDDMPHNVAEMHICYHATIMDLLRPFLLQNSLLSTFSTSPRRPEAIFTLSFGHLQELTQYYHTVFAGLPQAHTISWVHGPLYVAPAILHYSNHLTSWKSDFISAIDACTPLFQSHQMMEGLLRALLGMGIDKGALSKAEATEFLDGLLARREKVNRHAYEAPELGFIVDQHLAMDNLVAAKGDALVQAFDERLLRDDLFSFEHF